MKVKSVTNVITNSSSETFLVVNENAIDTVKNFINAILEAASSEKTCDELFDITPSLCEDIKEYWEDWEWKDEYLEKKFKVKDQFNQIDGAISRLLKIKEIVLDKVIQAKNENEDEVGGTAKQMVLMYLSSVLEIAYTKKAIWSLLQLRYYPN